MWRKACRAEPSQGTGSHALELGDKFPSGTWTPGEVVSWDSERVEADTGDSGGKLTPPRIHRVLCSKGVKDARGGALFSQQLEGGMLAYHLQPMEAGMKRSQTAPSSTKMWELDSHKG